jgi:parallel beta-helix repeat protein
VAFSSAYAPYLPTINPTPERVEDFSQALGPHNPISITRDVDFEKLGFEGNGTESSPYLISGLSIDADEEICISIITTSVHFVIQDCEFYSDDDDESGAGVYFEKVANGAVVDCRFHSLSIGISALKSESCEFNANRFVGLQKGIHLTQSLWMTTEGNEISKCGYGIHLNKVDYSDVIANTIGDSDYGLLIESSFDIRTSSNQVSGSFFGLYFHNSFQCESLRDVVSNSRYGLYLAYSQDCNVTSSKITGNKYGLSLLEVDGGFVSGNLVKANREFGIHLKDSRNVEVTLNMVFNNLGVGVFLSGVIGTSINNNEIGFNNGVNAADFVGSAVKGLTNSWDTNAWSDYRGATSYIISGDRGSVDNDPHYILFLDSPPDLTLEAPASGFINWSASAFKPDHFAITIDGLTIEEGVWNGDAISKSFTTLDPGNYTFAVSVSTMSGLATSDEVVLTVQDTTTPEWVQVPENQVIECGESLSYQLLATDSYGISKWWVNSSVFSINEGLLQNMTPLYYGAYHLEVRAYDPYDNFITQSLSIFVTDSIPPFVGSPVDIVFFEGEVGHQIIWDVFDCNPLSYEILVDGISVELGDWVPDMTHIQYSLDGLVSGTYIFSIVLTDIAGNFISDDVQVTVEAETPTETETPNTPTTSPSMESPTPTDGAMTGPNILVLGSIGIGASVAVIIVLIIAKKR